MQIHQVKRNTKQKKHTQLGRGGRHGKTSGRGGKGLTARAGFKRRPALKEAIKKLPKLRGYKFKSIQNAFYPVNLDALEKAFNSGDTVNLSSLVKNGAVRIKGDKNPRVKILGRGTLSKSLTIEGCVVSQTAKSAIEKAGGKIQ